ncbi:hypothetical protein SK128_020589, partial [Halocaridina rubra]
SRFISDSHIALESQYSPGLQSNLECRVIFESAFFSILTFHSGIPIPSGITDHSGIQSLFGISISWLSPDGGTGSLVNPSSLWNDNLFESAFSSILVPSRLEYRFSRESQFSLECQPLRNRIL